MHALHHSPLTTHQTTTHHTPHFSNPRPFIQASSFSGHFDRIGSFCASPTPCWPFSYSTNSTGTPAFSHAALNIRLFSVGTALSSTVSKRKIGGVSFVTCFSLE